MQNNIKIGISCLVLDSRNKMILLIKREKNPFKGLWTFPGGYLE